MPDPFRARDPAAAARASVVVQGASAGVVAAAALLDPTNATAEGQAACWTVVVLLLLGVLACRRTPAVRLDAAGALLAIPLLGAAAVNATNLATHDTSAAAQVFLVMPVLLAAAKLRRSAASLVAAVAVVGNLAVTLVLADPVRAVTDSVFTGVALVTVTVVLGTSQDRREELFRLLLHQASVDPLTGLLTRRALDEALAAAVGQAPGTALVLVDLDGFKGINDEHGHPVGDAALQHLADVLRRTVRSTDAIAGRLGGDELAVLLPRCTGEVAATRAADVLAAVRATPMVLPDGRRLALSVSIGVAQLAAGEADAHLLYSSADQALYQAKRGGRDRLAVAGTLTGSPAPSRSSRRRHRRPAGPGPATPRA